MLRSCVYCGLLLTAPALRARVVEWLAGLRLPAT